MKSAAKGKILPLFWLLIAAVQLFFAAQLAPAKSAFVPENRVRKIFPLATQTHQLERSQDGRDAYDFFGVTDSLKLQFVIERAIQSVEQYR
jgi:hypothetical protein